MVRSRRAFPRRSARDRTSKHRRAGRPEADPFALPPPSEPAHVDLIAQIEAFAPARYRVEREEVFRALQDDLRLAAAGKDGATPDDDYEGVLFNITIAYRPLNAGASIDRDYARAAQAGS